MSRSLIYSNNEPPIASDLLSRNSTSTQTTLPLIAHDVEKRNYFFKKAFSLIEKKSEMDLNYANLLEGIILKDFQKPVNESIPTQFLYNRLVDYCIEDCKRVRKVGERLKQHSAAMQSLYEKDVP